MKFNTFITQMMVLAFAITLSSQSLFANGKNITRFISSPTGKAAIQTLINSNPEAAAFLAGLAGISPDAFTALKPNVRNTLLVTRLEGTSPSQLALQTVVAEFFDKLESGPIDFNAASLDSIFPKNARLPLSGTSEPGSATGTTQDFFNYITVQASMFFVFHYPNLEVLFFISHEAIFEQIYTVLADQKFQQDPYKFLAQWKMTPPKGPDVSPADSYFAFKFFEELQEDGRLKFIAQLAAKINFKAPVNHKTKETLDKLIRDFNVYFLMYHGHLLAKANDPKMISAFHGVIGNHLFQHSPEAFVEAWRLFSDRFKRNPPSHVPVLQYLELLMGNGNLKSVAQAAKDAGITVADGATPISQIWQGKIREGQ